MFLRRCPPARWRRDARSLKDLTTAKPKPVPPCARAVVKNGSNTRAALAAEMPGPLSLTSMIRVAAIPVRGAGQATVMVAVSPLPGVIEQIAQDGFQHVLSHCDARGYGRFTYDDLELRRLIPGGEMLR